MSQGRALTGSDEIREFLGGRYHDRLVRLDGRWLFAERRNAWWTD